MYANRKKREKKGRKKKEEKKEKKERAVRTKLCGDQALFHHSVPHLSTPPKRPSAPTARSEVLPPSGESLIIEGVKR